MRVHLVLVTEERRQASGKTRENLSLVKYNLKGSRRLASDPKTLGNSESDDCMLSLYIDSFSRVQFVERSECGALSLLAADALSSPQRTIVAKGWRLQQPDEPLPRLLLLSSVL